MPDYGMFGRVWVRAMQEYQPAEARRLEKVGRLQAEALKFDAQAMQSYEKLLSELEKQSPPPEKHPERAGHMTMLAEQAKEQVIVDLISTY